MEYGQVGYGIIEKNRERELNGSEITYEKINRWV